MKRANFLETQCSNQLIPQSEKNIAVECSMALSTDLIGTVLWVHSIGNSK